MLQQTSKIHSLSLELSHLVHLYLGPFCPLLALFTQWSLQARSQALVLFPQFIYFSSLFAHTSLRPYNSVSGGRANGL